MCIVLKILTLSRPGKQVGVESAHNNFEYIYLCNLGDMLRNLTRNNLMRLVCAH